MSDNFLGITEISDKLCLPKSTVSRLISTLMEKQLIKKDEKTKKYGLGIKLFELGWQFINKLELRNIVRPFLEELVKQINETGHFVIEDQGEIVYVDKIETTHSLRQYSQIGKRAPMHCTAVGKAILAYKSEEEIDLIIKTKGLKKFTSNTITDPEKLKKELEEIVKNGYAVDNEEIQEYLRCVAAPIFNYSNEIVGAISISGPTIRVKNIEEITQKVKDTAQKISIQLGYNSKNFK